MDGWIDAWIDRQMDRWMHAWIDKLTDGQIDAPIHYASYHVKNSKDICGYILMAMIVHHVAVDHHQRLHIQPLPWMRFKRNGSLPSGH